MATKVMAVCRSEISTHGNNYSKSTCLGNRCEVTACIAQPSSEAKSPMTIVTQPIMTSPHTAATNWVSSQGNEEAQPSATVLSRRHQSKQ